MTEQKVTYTTAGYEPILPVESEDGVGDNPDNHPPATFLQWATVTRAAKIQHKNALQEQVRAVGMEIAALEKMIENEKSK